MAPMPGRLEGWDGMGTAVGRGSSATRLPSLRTRSLPAGPWSAGARRASALRVCRTSSKKSFTAGPRAPAAFPLDAGRGDSDSVERDVEEEAGRLGGGIRVGMARPLSGEIQNQYRAHALKVA